jgi:hypothetical protein
VDHRARFLTLNAIYEEFLFASVCEDANGMRLSVISALARTNVDPWEEASRLAAMPKAIRGEDAALDPRSSLRPVLAVAGSGSHCRTVGSASAAVG